MFESTIGQFERTMLALGCIQSVPEIVSDDSGPTRLTVVVPARTSNPNGTEVAKLPTFKVTVPDVAVHRNTTQHNASQLSADAHTRYRHPNVPSLTDSEPLVRSYVPPLNTRRLAPDELKP